MKRISIFSVLLCFLATTQKSWSKSDNYHLGFRIAPRISTLGGGLEVAKGITPWFGLRGGVNYFTWDYDGEESDIEYDSNLELKSFALFADVHPFKQAFRISAGFLINGNELTGKGKPRAILLILGMVHIAQMTLHLLRLTYLTVPLHLILELALILPLETMTAGVLSLT